VWGVDGEEAGSLVMDRACSALSTTEPLLGAFAMKRLLIAALAVSAIFAHAELVEMTVQLANPVLETGKKQKTFLRVGLTANGVITTTGPRAAANVALVIDRSSSMSGEKIREAREAAVMALRRLNENDIVSVVAYSDGVQVLVPATKLSDRASVEAAIRSLRPSGSTALFAGVSKGAAEVRKFASSNRINRVILLSDGQANRGPSSPASWASWERR
jgi:Ca-activated chloride channel homolog